MDQHHRSRCYVSRVHDTNIHSTEIPQKSYLARKRSFRNNNEKYYITSNDRSLGSPINYTDTIHYAILFIDTSTILNTTKLFLIGKPYMAIIASEDVTD